ERKVGAYKKAMLCFSQAAARLAPPVERVEIPYEGASLPAYFVPAEGVKSPRAPAVIFFDGLDATKEQLYLIGGRELVKRGLACLIVDGPGTGEALRLRNLHLRPDYERAATAAVDYLETRADVDPQRVGIMAISLGGYYAPRSAACEKRLKACVAWGAIYDYHEVWQRRIAAGVRTGSPVSAPLFQIQWVLGVNSPEAALEKLKAFTLKDVAPQITCPLLIVHGEEDAQIPVADARKLYEATGSVRKQLKILTAAEGGAMHCQLDNFHLAHYYIFDWLADTLR
ncbi:MAG: alpha/beta hydrolase, partial [Deltaproteobacteria bacterium]|nr:alpha/beta hydrolase [Deltaproteobacteria bacterium]